MNDGKNMAGMVSEKVQACGDGFCDRAVRDQAAREAVGRFSPKERAVMYGMAADAAKAPCCPCLVAHHPACNCRCHANSKAPDKLDPAFYAPGEAKLAKEFHAPGKQFSRSDILAILRAQHTLARLETSTSEWKAAKNSTYRDIINIFENLE